MSLIPYIALNRKRHVAMHYWRITAIAALMGLAIVSCSSAYAQAAAYVLRVPGVTITLTRQACEGAAAEQVIKLGGKPADWRAGTATINGKLFAHCWAASGPNVVLVYEDGDTGGAPQSAFAAERAM